MGFFNELKRRNVFRVTIAYVIVGWLIMQVGEVMAPALRLPDWVLSTLAFFIILGFPVAIIFAWAFEMTPEGLKRESEVDRSQSITHSTGRKLDFFIIAVLAVAVIVLMYDRFAPGQARVEQPSAVQPDVAAATQSDRKAIAVLPFENLSANEENAYFAAGVHEDILTYLTRIADLKVNSRTSVAQYAGTKLNLKQVADELGAAFIVEGSVRRAGDRVRVTAQLIDARTDEHLWADNFDRELTDIFEIQTAIAQEIVSALHATLLPQAQAMLDQQPTDSIEAYDLFLKGRLAQQSSERDNVFSPASEQFLLQALEIDPEYAQAWVLLAVSHGDYYWFGETRTPERLELMKQAIDKAAALQPDLPELALARASYFYRGFYNYSAALEQLELARKMMPNDAEVYNWLGLTLRRLGRYRESVDAYQEAVRLDPAHSEAWAQGIETATSSHQKGRAMEMLEALPPRFQSVARFGAERAVFQLKFFGDIEQARRELESVEASDNYWYLWSNYLTSGWARDYRAAAQVALAENYFNAIAPGWGQGDAAYLLRLGGFEEEADQLLRQGLVLAEAELALPRAENYSWPHAGYARLLVQLGRSEEALTHCRRGLEILGPDKDKVHGLELFFYCAWVKAMAGQVDEAVADIEQALSARWMLTPWNLALDPIWDVMRGNPRFDEMAAQAETWNPE